MILRELEKKPEQTFNPMGSHLAVSKVSLAIHILHDQRQILLSRSRHRKPPHKQQLL